MNERLSKALSELQLAAQEDYGDDTILDIRFDIRLGQSRDDLIKIDLNKYLNELEGKDDIEEDGIDGDK